MSEYGVVCFEKRTPPDGGKTLKERAVLMLARLVLVAALLLPATPAAFAQFYKDKTLTLLVNYGVGGNADTEARVYQQHLGKYIPGHPTIIIRNMPGAGGVTAMNQLGLNIGSQPDGLTLGYFTMSATVLITDDPVLRIKMDDLVPIAAARGWNVVYARKDIVPGGYTKPADFARARNIYAGGYSRASSQDTRLRLVLEVMNLPYKMVTGFASTAQLNKAMVQSEVNFTSSSLPGFQTTVVPQIINTGIGVPLFQFSIVGPDGKPAGNAELERRGLPILDAFYQAAFGKPPSGPKYQALLLTNDIATKMQRGMFLPKGSPPEAIAALRQAFAAVAADPAFIADYRKITGEAPDLVSAQVVEQIFDRIRNVSPGVKQVLKDSIAEN
jgi:tripartite-type tricarboxylate transporter receptor subunit TctC